MSTAFWSINTDRFGEKFEISSDDCWVYIETTVEDNSSRTTIKIRMKPNETRDLANALFSAAARTESLLKERKS